MPQNKLQECIYALITVLLTVPCFVVYCTTLETGSILALDLPTALLYCAIEIPLAWLSAHFFASPLALKLAFKNFPPAQTPPKLLQTAIICYTASIMCPWMSFLAVIIYQIIFPALAGAPILAGSLGNFLPLFLQTVVTNFPFALLGQIFAIQPATRKIFGLIFAKSLSESENEETAENPTPNLAESTLPLKISD